MSGANLFGGFLFGTVGFFALMVGKKQANFKMLSLGILLMAFPYFVESTVWLYVIGAGLTALLFIFRD